jgi:4-hydroxy-2-oxoheptanedioate aldolase
MSSENLSAMLCAVASGGAKSLVRVSAYDDRGGIQQALDLGADGILVPYINTAAEAVHAVSCCRYPTAGTRSVYFPQRSTNKKGLLGYVSNSNKNVIIALQIETADSIKNMDAIAAVDGVDMLFLGQNDLCMSMGLFEIYQFPEMYFSKELQAATDKLISAAKKNNKILGLFLFGTDRVAEFIKKGFVFISIGNDLHHILTQAQTHVKALKDISAKESKQWQPRKNPFT